MQNITLTRYQTDTILNQLLIDETHSVQVMPQGNAILCHAFYKSGDGVATLNFYQYTTGQAQGERTPIGSLELTGFQQSAKPITLMSIHDRVIVEVVVTGTVEVGILGTVIDQFAIELGNIELGDIDVAASAQFLEGHVFSAAADKGTIALGVDENGQLKAPRIEGGSLHVDYSAKVSGRVTEVTITDDAWTAIPATALPGRRAICIQNASPVAMKINYVDDVDYVGMEVKKDQQRSYDLKEYVTLFARSSAGSITINVEELA